MKRMFLAVSVLAAVASARAEIQIINGQKWECRDGMCFPVEDDASPAVEALPARETPPVETPPVESVASGTVAAGAPRLAQGYMGVEDFLSFLENREIDETDGLAGKAWWLILLAVLFGGLCMNLTPCVLPMVPVNLMIIGRSATRGALYGAGIAVAYGAMGLLAALGGTAFGEIQGSPWFNAAVAVLFVVLALALSDVFFIDFSKKRNALAAKRGSMWPGLFAFFMGAVSAVLAGACVAPVLISVLLLTASLFAKGVYMALALPFVLGLGMALPWPFAGAGLQALPKPGAWMAKVNKAFSVVVLCFAAWYGYLAYTGFTGAARDVREAGDGASAGVVAFASPAEFSLDGLTRPVLVDCWATWCKNCTAMEHETFADERVKKALSRFTVVKLQAEDIKALKALPGFGGVMGLPAFLVFE